MRRYSLITLVLIIVLLLSKEETRAQEKSYSLSECIETAWNNSTDISRAKLSLSSVESTLEQSKAARNPNLFLSGSGNVSSNNQYDATSSSWDREANSDVSLQLSSSFTIYNGAKLKNAILQNQVDLEAASSDIQTQNEILALNILSAYINVLYAEEQAKNYDAQFASTKQELNYTKERREAGVIAKSEYLNMKSQYASDQAASINAKSQVRILKVALMQLMNIPVEDDFAIQQIDTETIATATQQQNPGDIYNLALGLQPSIATAKLDLESTEYDIKIAKADAMPVITMNGSVGTGYNQNYNNLDFGSQIKNQVNPTLGISISVPIYQRKQVKNSIAQATLQQQNIELELTDIKNNLRQSIEQVYTDAQVASADYNSATDQLIAQEESFHMAEEMFRQGLINSTEYLIIKNNLIEAEINVTQSKFQVLLQNKFINYYKGEWEIGTL